MDYIIKKLQGECDKGISPLRRRGRRVSYFYWEAEIWKLPPGWLFVFRPLTGKQNYLNLCDLCASAV